MKKLLSGIFFLMALGLGFTACSDDDDDATYNGAPEKETAGTYAGTWTRVDLSDESATTASGTLTFEATETPYVTKVTAVCADLDVDNQDVANITYAGDKYLYDNQRTPNVFGAPFSGKITLDRVAGITYQITITEGRKKNTYRYSFEGTKQ